MLVGARRSWRASGPACWRSIFTTSGFLARHDLVLVGDLRQPQVLLLSPPLALVVLEHCSHQGAGSGRPRPGEALIAPGEP